jgi:1-hydroxycarotenoid 3,4-desaturase
MREAMVAGTAIIVGGGVGGLTAAVSLASRGVEVTLLERAARVGGKLSDFDVGGQWIDSGPTVLTKRSIFETVFREAGDDFARHVRLTPLDVLARHAWSDGARLDLFADEPRSVEAIAAFAGGRAADGYRRFSADARRTYETLDAPFMQRDKTSLPMMLARIAARGVPGLKDMWALQPYASLWRELGRYFDDLRLRQLFARYATYCGGSPFQSPATLMLVAHLEQQGVWSVDGGMQRLAEALGALATRAGATLITQSDVETVLIEGGRATGVRLDTGRVLKADAVVFNGDVAALNAMTREPNREPSTRTAVPRRALGPRSLSAMTMSVIAETRGLELAHHTVCFGDDYRAEFDAIFKHGTICERPTVYVCAPDHNASQGDAGQGKIATPQRLFCLINAPANGDDHIATAQEIDQWQLRIFAHLQRCGLTVIPRSAAVVSTPSDFHRRFPATGGALYGPAPHTVLSAFSRAGSRTRIPGLYLAGGSLHPGPGLPMAAQSGRLAAQCLLADLASSRMWHPVATRGGTSTASATTARTR